LTEFGDDPGFTSIATLKNGEVQLPSMPSFCSIPPAVSTSADVIGASDLKPTNANSFGSVRKSVEKSCSVPSW
jgi:hypothetical protein